MGKIKETQSPALVAAHLERPPKDDGESLFTITQHQLATITGNADYANQPVLQGIVKSAQANLGLLGGTLGELAEAHAAIPPLEAKRNLQIATVRRDRHSIQGALTAICAGNLALIRGWGATPGGARTATPDSTDAPSGVKATPSKTTPGTVNGKCPKIPGAATYFWVLSTDSGLPAPGVQPMVTTGCRAKFNGQAIGHVMYLRVAVVRRHGGVSAWSEAAQVTVR